MAYKELKKQYEDDALWMNKPWTVWEWAFKDVMMDWQKLNGPPQWLGEYEYRRKPGAPSKCCPLCKHSSIEEYACGTARVCNLIGEIMKYINKPCPDWCPLDQPKGEPAFRISQMSDEEWQLWAERLWEEHYTYKALKAAKDLLSWLEGFDLLHGAEKVKAMRKALDELEGK